MMMKDLYSKTTFQLQWHEDIKEIVKNNFPKREYVINGCNITIKNERLERLHELVDEYFNEFQS